MTLEGKSSKREEVRQWTKLKEMNLIIKERSLRWLGHVLCMEHDRIPKQSINQSINQSIFIEYVRNAHKHGISQAKPIASSR